MVASRRRYRNVDSRLINAAVVAILCLGRHGENKCMCSRLFDPFPEAGPQRLAKFLGRAMLAFSASVSLGNAHCDGRAT